MTCEIPQISLLFPCHVLTITKIASAVTQWCGSLEQSTFGC